MTGPQAAQAAADAMADFVASATTPLTSVLVPEITLQLARAPQRIFQAIEALDIADDSRLPPYWAFAWPGGQATARYLLDHRHIVGGSRVVDIGSGSGIAAIAAAMAGARTVLAADIDPVAEVAIRLNAALNGVEDHVTTTTADLLATPPDADLVLLSDLVYEPELALRVGSFLESAVRRGIPVLVADRMSARRPTAVAEELACYVAPLTPALVDDYVENGRVWRVRDRVSGKARPNRKAKGR